MRVGQPIRKSVGGGVLKSVGRLGEPNRGDVGRRDWRYAPVIHLAATDYSGFTLPIAEGLTSDVCGVEARRARRVERDSRPTQVEVVRHAVGNHGWNVGERACRLSVVLCLSSSIIDEH